MTHPTLILGGGIIGLTTAYNLQQRGVATTLIDADTSPPNTTTPSPTWPPSRACLPSCSIRSVRCASTGATCRASSPLAAA